MIPIDRVEGIVRIVPVDWVRRIAGIVSVHGIEGTVWGIFVDWIQRIVSLILVDGVEDIVVPLVSLIEAHSRPGHRGP